MAWVKIDDKWANHPKLVTVGPLGKSLYMDGLCYSAQYLTDGFIPSASADFLCLPFREFGELPILDGDIYKPIEWLVNQGLWQSVDGGYQIHDYLDYNPSKAQTILERESAKERMKRAREHKDNSEDVQPKFNRSSDNPVPVPRPVPLVPTEPNGSSELESERVTALPIKPDPKPRAHRLPREWAPDEAAIQWAVNSTGLSPADVAAETEKFRDHFGGNGKPMTDWLATWRNWVRRSLDFRPATPIRIRSSPKPQLPPVMQPGHVPKDGGLAEWRNAQNPGAT